LDGGGVMLGLDGRRRFAALLWAAMVVVSAQLALSATAAGEATWKWSKAYALPHAPMNISGLSCPTKKLCVTAGEVGNAASNSATQGVFWTTNPRGGRSSWHYLALEPQSQPKLSHSGEPFTAVSCADIGGGAPSYCAATDGFANLWQTGNPGAGKPWSQSIPDEIAMEDLSCWPGARCGMLDIDGNAVITLGATVTSATNVFNSPPDGDFAGSIACVASGFCAATEAGTKRVGWTTDSTAAPVSWHTATVHGGATFGSIACPTAKLCVATEAGPPVGLLPGRSSIGVSHDPASGGGTWKAVKLPSSDGALSVATCESSSLCAAGGSVGGNGAVFVLISTHPSAKVSAWHRTSLHVTELAGLSCPTTSECVASGWNGKAWSVTVGRPG
jgi:hypothetical protein